MSTTKTQEEAVQRLMCLKFECIVITHDAYRSFKVTCDRVLQSYWMCATLPQLFPKSNPNGLFEKNTIPCVNFTCICCYVYLIFLKICRVDDMIFADMYYRPLFPHSWWGYHRVGQARVVRVCNDEPWLSPPAKWDRCACSCWLPHKLLCWEHYAHR